MKRSKFNKEKIIKTSYAAVFIMILFGLPVLFFQPGMELTAQKERWTAVNHDKTNFPLVGKHRSVPCADCHLEGVLEGTPTDCESCHWTRKQDDRYKLQLGIHCGDCHTPFDWKRLKSNSWDHGRETDFMLEGIHKTLDCIRCHPAGVFSKQPRECYFCHREQYDEAANPNHAAGRFPTDCRVCHRGMSAWSGAVFDHTKFPLKGLHITTGCTACHKNNVYAGLPSGCVDCHLENYNNANTPNHKQAGFPFDCTMCHSSGAVSWQGAGFIHTRFILKGNHLTAACTDCHKNGVYIGTPSQCVACHLTAYDNTTSPNHKAAGFATDCERCHGSDALTWLGAVLDHSFFPLNGKHKTIACIDCHINNKYAGTPKECVGCHLTDYDNAVNPNHKQAGYSTDCINCHGVGAVSWQGATVDHSFFPLNGKHKTIACTDCHINNKYAGTPKECVGCHLTAYNNTVDPNHKAAGFPTDCVPCHGTGAVSWQGATFNHSTFPLKGKHLTAVCTACHINNKYVGTPKECVGCHLTAYNNTVNPNHKAAGFPTDCVPCHGAAALTWQNAVFNHSQYWPLQGAHVALDCNKCHSAGYNLPRDCYGCHRSDYEAALNPNHKTAGFPTTCETCHFSTHTSWSQAVFIHKFPINTGRHSGFACTDCHISSNYLTFSCINCHSHTKSAMDSAHNDVKGYTYNSQACYTCHPDGRAGG